MIFDREGRKDPSAETSFYVRILKHNKIDMAEWTKEKLFGCGYSPQEETGVCSTVRLEKSLCP